MKKSLVRATLLVSLVLTLPIAVMGGAVPIDGPWQVFAFYTVGTPARGCWPADPDGNRGCSLGPNSEFANAPPWTFTAPAEGAVLTVVDAYNSGDVFTIFDFGTPIGSTSAAVTGDYCGDDPEVCLLYPNMSSGVFALTVGSHAITIVPTASPFETGGAAYFRVKSGWSLHLPMVLRSASE